MNNDERGPWYLLTGVIIGAILGLVFAWIVQPVEYVDTAPESLNQDAKDRYRVLIAAAYASNGDLLRAQARLELLGDDDIHRSLSEQAQRKISQNGSSSDARNLGMLAMALESGLPGFNSTHSSTRKSPGFNISATSSDNQLGTPSPENTLDQSNFTQSVEPSSETQDATLAPMNLLPLKTNTNYPGNQTTLLIGTSTRTGPSILKETSTPKSNSPFVLLNREKDCDKELEVPLIQIQASDQSGQSLPGVLIIVAWDGGEERFYTGLKPEKGLGYADFTPEPGITYTLRLGENGQPVLDLSAVKCQSSNGKDFWGAWSLKFITP